MCIAIPAEIREIIPGPLPMARLVQASREIECCLAYVPEAQVGDHVLVQRGYAVEVLDPDSAADSLAAFEELGLVGGG